MSQEQVFSSPASADGDCDNIGGLNEKILFFEKEHEAQSRRIRQPLNLAEDPLLADHKSKIRFLATESIKRNEEDGIFASSELESGTEENLSEEGKSSLETEGGEMEIKEGEEGFGNISEIESNLNNATSIHPRDKHNCIQSPDKLNSNSNNIELGPNTIISVSNNISNSTVSNSTDPNNISNNTIYNSNTISNTVSDSTVSNNTTCNRISPPLPTSNEFLQNFINSELRPPFLKSPLLSQKNVIHSKTLYKNSRLIFSDSHFSKMKFLFRAPGAILPGRPTVSIQNSIITERGVLHFLQIHSSCQNGASWFLLKDIISHANSNSLADISYYLNSIQSDDALLNSFILSDVVASIHRRTNYLFFNNKLCIGKFLGDTLCICIKDQIIKIIKLENKESIWKEEDLSICAYGLVISLSCSQERDEWYKAMTTC